MPIYEASGSLILHFGYGDIAISTGRNVEKTIEDELVFTGQSPPKPIGRTDDGMTGLDSQYLGSPVRMIFDQVESLDVLIEQAQALRQKMADGKAKMQQN